VENVFPPLKFSFPVLFDSAHLLLSGDVRLEVLMAVNIKNAAYRDVTPCSLVERYQYFGGTRYLHLQGRKVDQL
jgi:hypothetical protein